MPPPRSAEPALLVDALLDLQHDLGKYLRMPIAFLPREADASALRAALHKALRQTRSGPDGVRSARSLWGDFEREVGGALAGRPGYVRLVEAVRTALAWEAALDDADAVLDRQRIEAELGAVATAIRELIGASKEVTELSEPTELYRLGSDEGSK